MMRSKVSDEVCRNGISLPIPAALTRQSGRPLRVTTCPHHCIHTRLVSHINVDSGDLIGTGSRLGGGSVLHDHRGALDSGETSGNDDYLSTQSYAHARFRPTTAESLYFLAVTVISICPGPTSLATTTVVRVGLGSLK
jgi:hypothetical protein